MITKLDWILQSETGWQKFTQKTKRQPEKIFSDFKKLQGTNAATLGKPPQMPKMIQVSGIGLIPEFNYLGICFCSKQVYIIQQDSRDFFVICLEKWCHSSPFPSLSQAPPKVFLFGRPRRSGPRASRGTASQGDPTKNNSYQAGLAIFGGPFRFF